jgi:hypothetical protein
MIDWDDDVGRRALRISAGAAVAGLVAAGAGGVFYLRSQAPEVRETDGREGAESTLTPSPEPTVPETVSSDSSGDIKEVRRKTTAQTDETCSPKNKAQLEAAKALAAGLCGEISSTYQCAEGEVTMYGQPVLGFVIPDLTRIQVTSALLDERNEKQQAAAVCGFHLCAQNPDACEDGAYTGPGKNFYPGGEIGAKAIQVFKELDEAEGE